MWKVWNALRGGPYGPLFFRNGLKVAADGTFRIEGMDPDGKERVGGTRVLVPAEDRDDADPAPHDAGEVTAK